MVDNIDAGLTHDKMEDQMSKAKRTFTTKTPKTKPATLYYRDGRPLPEHLARIVRLLRKVPEPQRAEIEQAIIAAGKAAESRGGAP